MSANALVKSSLGKYQTRKDSPLKVGSRITIQPDNLTPRRQYLAHATGEITAIKGNKASVLLDEPSNKSYKSQTIKIDLCSLKLISAQGSGQDFHMQESLLEDSSCKDSVKLTNSAANDCAIASPVSESTPTCENFGDYQQQTSSHLRHHAPHSLLKENVWEAQTRETVSEQFCDKLDSSNPSLQLSKTCLDCYQPPLFPETNPAHILGRCSGSFMAVGTMRNGLLSEHKNITPSGQGKGSCLLPRPGALSKSSESSRPPGNTKSEAKAKNLGIIQKNEVFNPEWLELQFGLPVGWTSPQEHRAATELLAPVDPPSEIVLTPDLQQLPCVDSCTSTRSVAKKSDCWYTPLHIVDLVKRVLGEIDLDPCADDGRHIPAALHYTAKDDGLSKPWHGRIFFNPPYSCPGKWVAWFLQEYAALRVTEAIALLPAATDTNWLSPVLKTQPVCFWKGRIKFLDENYKPMRQGARQSHVLVYWGENWQKFKEVFNSYGFVSVPNSPSTQLSNDNQVLGENLLPSITPSTQVQGNDQVLDTSLLLSIHPNTQVSNDNEVLGGNISPKIPPSTQLSDGTQVLGESLLPSITPSTQVSNDNEVLGGNISPKIPPSTTERGDEQPLTEAPLPNSVLSNNHQVLGGNISPKISPSTTETDKKATCHNPLPIDSQSTKRKYGSGSGNLFWGHANANSSKKKPIKQLYFEWEYGGVRGKTYVRSHLKEQVIALNEAKVPITEILKLLTYNPKVKRVLCVD